MVLVLVDLLISNENKDQKIHVEERHHLQTLGVLKQHGYDDEDYPPEEEEQWVD